MNELDDNAVEFKVDGRWFAWDERGVVYIYSPEMAADFEDGYVPIGEYIPPADEPEFDWRKPLTAYAREYLKNKERTAMDAGERKKEPYAWMAVGGSIWRHKTSEDDVPLYTSPPERKPLTEEEIADAANSVKWSQQYHVDYARAIERAHGIGGSDD